jgi:D-alanine-D-alanine ligase
MKTKNETKIILLAGGASTEREVSKSSSAGIYKALKSLGYNVTVIDPALGIVQYDNAEKYFLPDEEGTKVSSLNYIPAISLPVFDDADLVFLGLHGRWGEDGTIQSLLQLRGLKYTGPAVLACALAMNKGQAKIIFQNSGVIVPEGFNVFKESFEYAIDKEWIMKDFGFPVIVKPNDEGSTFGLTLVEKEEDLEQAFEFAFKYSNNVLIEEYIPGRELTVGLYDFECKYTSGMSEYIVPAPIDDDLAAFIQEQTLLAYHSLGCKGYSRVDFRLSPDNKPFCLEVNTLPGMTATSLLPKMAKHKGMSYEELVDTIVRISL